MQSRDAGPSCSILADWPYVCFLSPRRPSGWRSNIYYHRSGTTFFATVRCGGAWKRGRERGRWRFHNFCGSWGSTLQLFWFFPSQAPQLIPLPTYWFTLLIIFFEYYDSKGGTAHTFILGEKPRMLAENRQTSNVQINVFVHSLYSSICAKYILGASKFAE